MSGLLGYACFPLKELILRNVGILPSHGVLDTLTYRQTIEAQRFRRHYILGSHHFRMSPTSFAEIGAGVAIETARYG